MQVVEQVVAASVEADRIMGPIESLLARTTAAAASAAASNDSVSTSGNAASEVAADEHALADALRAGFEFFAQNSDLEAPAALVTTRVWLDKLSTPLAAAIHEAPRNTVLIDTGGDPKTVAYRVRTQHPDTSAWDPESKFLRLPPVRADEIVGLTSIEALGAAIARETGVGRVTLEHDGKEFTIKVAIGVEAIVVEGTLEPKLKSGHTDILDGTGSGQGGVPGIDFYHGTDEGTAEAMARGGLAITASGRGEFGAGFYTFLDLAAAGEAAAIYTRNRNRGFTSWGVVDFDVPAQALASYFEASTVADLMHRRLPNILVFPDKTTPVTVNYPYEWGGAERSVSWTEFLEDNAANGKEVAWPCDLIIGPLKGKLRSQKAGVNQWVFGADGVGVLNSSTVRRMMAASGDL